MSEAHVETVIIGGGQAGLAVGYHLARHGRPFVILDSGARVGDSWRTRWDSLELFTPARYSSLPGMTFPAPGWSYPTKDQVADYLAAYASRFELDVRPATTVDSLARIDRGYVIETGNDRFTADHVVVATGAHSHPRVPAFASDLAPDITQLHSSQYVNPSQLRDGAVLVVGAGNSGAEIAVEVSGTHRTWLSGPDTGHLPFRTGSLVDKALTPAFWFFISRVLTVGTPIGRRAQPAMLSKPGPLERFRPKELAAAGVERVAARTVGVRGGAPILDDGRALDVANVIWCTGFRPAFPWVDLPIFDGDGHPRHVRGVVPAAPGLYFVGLFFLYGLTSHLIGGVGRDAERIADHITSRDRRMALSLGRSPSRSEPRPRPRRRAETSDESA
jgi:putative flavoprotein involved in K+ transport